MAIALSSSLTRMSSSVRPTLSGRRMISPSLEAIKNIQGTFIKKGKVRREILEKQNVLKNRRLEKERRKRQEDELEAPNVVARPDGPFEVTQKSNKGFLERILGFLGYLGAGWLLNNLPTLIAMGKEFVGRVQRMGQLIGGFVTNITNIFTGFGNLLSASFQNLVQFDLFDTSNRVKDAFGQLTGSVDDMGKELEEALKLITTPLTEGMVTGEDAPPTGQERTSEGAYEPGAPLQTGDGVPGSGGKLLPIHKQALDIISRPESGGDYNAMNNGRAGDRPGGSKKWLGKNLTEMTIGEVLDFQQNKKQLWAAGRYQFVPNTLPGLVKSAGLGSNDKFDKNNQDLMAATLIQQRGIQPWTVGGSRYSDKEKAIVDQARKTPFGTTVSAVPSQVIPGRGGSSNAGTALAKTAERLQQQRFDTSRYGKDGCVFAVNEVYRASGMIPPWGTSVYVPTARQILVQKKFIQVGINGARPGDIVIMLDKHPTEPWVHIGIVSTKGTVIHNSSTNRAFTNNESFSTLSRRYVKIEVFRDPNLTDFAAPPARGLESPRQPSPAQIASIRNQQQTQQRNQQLSQDRTGPTVIVQEPSEPESQAPSYSGGGAPGMMPLEIDEFTLVNRFIKNKLLLDLAYL
jgi:hypothetical protein